MTPPAPMAAPPLQAWTLVIAPIHGYMSQTRERPAALYNLGSGS